jgi:superfamily II DNA helicase RecQ
MRSSKFTEDVAVIVGDEAHCISQWGAHFRKRFAELGRLRSYVPTTVPFLATSATLPPLVLADVQDKLRFSADNTLPVNLGNDRLNITPILCSMHGAAKDLAALDFLVDEALSGDPPKRTIVFFNSKDLTSAGYEHFRELLPDGLQDQVGFLHAWRDTTAKRKVMKDFRSGQTRILCATEAAGMASAFTT